MVSSSLFFLTSVLVASPSSRTVLVSCAHSSIASLCIFAAYLEKQKTERGRSGISIIQYICLGKISRTPHQDSQLNSR